MASAEQSLFIRLDRSKSYGVEEWRVEFTVCNGLDCKQWAALAVKYANMQSGEELDCIMAGLNENEAAAFWRIDDLYWLALGKMEEGYTKKCLENLSEEEKAAMAVLSENTDDDNKRRILGVLLDHSSVVLGMI
jgi:hypothetical protein